MAIIFMDSFDHYNSLPQKGWENGNGFDASGRTGSCAYVYGNYITDTNGAVSRTFQTAPDEIIVCSGLKLTDFDTWRWELSEGATVHIKIAINGSNQITVSRGDDTLLGTGSLALSTNTWYFLEVRVKISDTIGTVKVSIDDAVQLDLSGVDTRNGGTSGVIDKFSHILTQGPFATGARYAYLDDFIVMDTSGETNNDFLGSSAKIDVVMPNGNGNSSQFVGSDGNSTDNYLLVDENPNDGDTSYVESGTVGNKDTYAFENPTVGDPIRAVQINTYAKKNDAGARSIATISRVGGVEDVSSEEVLQTSYIYNTDIYETNPGGDLWSYDDINGAEFGFKVNA